MIESCIVAESHSLENTLQYLFLEASYRYYDEVFRDIYILDLIMASEFRLERESALYLLYGFVAFQCIASYDEYLIVPFPMPFGFHIVPHLIKEEKHEKTYEGAHDDDESRDSEKEDESLSEVSDECDGDDPIDPCLGECLKISLDRFMEFIEILDDPYTYKCECSNDTKSHILLIIDHRYLELYAWYEIGEKTYPVHHIEHENDQSYVKDRPKQAQEHAISAFHDKTTK